MICSRDTQFPALRLAHGLRRTLRQGTREFVTCWSMIISSSYVLAHASYHVVWHPRRASQASRPTTSRSCANISTSILGTSPFGRSLELPTAMASVATLRLPGDHHPLTKVCVRSLRQANIRCFSIHQPHRQSLDGTCFCSDPCFQNK